MAKQNSTTPAITGEAAQQAFNDLAVSGESAVSFEQAFDMLENCNPEQLQELTQEYFSFDKPGQIISFVVEGFDTATIQAKPVEVVKLRSKDHAAFINGDKVLVSSCKRLKLLPAWIRVEYKGDIKNATGTYKNLIVKTFPG